MLADLGDFETEVMEEASELRAKEVKRTLLGKPIALCDTETASAVWGGHYPLTGHLRSVLGDGQPAEVRGYSDCCEPRDRIQCAHWHHYRHSPRWRPARCSTCCGATAFPCPGGYLGTG